MKYIALLLLAAVLLSLRPALAATVPPEVVAHYNALAQRYPAVKRPAFIIARSGVAWTVSYERDNIWVNPDKPLSEIKAQITAGFAKRAYAWLRYNRPKDARYVDWREVYRRLSARTGVR
jgi:hypothetical protein